MRDAVAQTLASNALAGELAEAQAEVQRQAELDAQQAQLEAEAAAAQLRADQEQEAANRVAEQNGVTVEGGAAKTNKGGNK